MYLAILLNRYSEVRSEVSSAPPLLKVSDLLQSWLVDIISIGSKSLANRVRSTFNNRKMRNKFQDVRYLLLRSVVLGNLKYEHQKLYCQGIMNTGTVSKVHVTAVHETLNITFSTYNTG